MFYVEFYSAKRPGEKASERYDTLADAVENCRILIDRAGAHPSIRCDDFRAIPTVDKMAVRRVLKWSMSFPSRDGFKNAACHRAELAGVRYASHRRGYVASDRAFDQFCTAWSEFSDRRSLPEVGADAARVAA